jgi:hypothetical protein
VDAEGLGQDGGGDLGGQGEQGGAAALPRADPDGVQPLGEGVLGDRASGPDEPVDPGRPGQSPVVEQLTISAAGDGGLVALRTTPDQDPVSHPFPLPGPGLMACYRVAVAEASRLSPNRSSRSEGKTQELSAALAEAVHPEVRQRIEGASSLVVVELTVDGALEEYPWELIAGPGALGGMGDVTVCRRVEAPPPLTPKDWSDTVLLAGSEAMRTGATYVHPELDMIADELESSGTVKVRREPYLVISRLRGLLDLHRPAVFHLAAHGTQEGLHLQNQRGPTLESLTVTHDALASELGSSHVKVALLNCCDSAAPPSSGERPAAYRIAARADATVVGMARKIQSHADAVFGKAV